MTNYKVQDGCHNCQHCHTNDEYDWTELYCVKGVGLPLFSSKIFNLNLTEREQDAAFEDLYKFEEERRVDDAGICDDFQSRGPKSEDS